MLRPYERNPMKVAANCVVSLEYSLHLGDGEVIDSSEGGEPLVYLHGAGQIVPGLERQLDGMEVGDSKQVVIAPTDGYGEREQENVRQESRAKFGDQPIQAGDELVAIDEDHNQLPVRIEKIEGDEVTVDFNHPLAGKTLHFDVKVRDVRAATAEELSHGHVHGAGCHHHH